MLDISYYIISCTQSIKLTRKKLSKIFLSLVLHHGCIRIFITKVRMLRFHASKMFLFHMCIPSRPLVKSAYQNITFLISQSKHMLWVLKRTVSVRRFF